MLVALYIQRWEQPLPKPTIVPFTLDDSPSMSPTPNQPSTKAKMASERECYWLFEKE